MKVDIRNALLPDEWNINVTKKVPPFTDITLSSGINYQHNELDYILILITKGFFRTNCRSMGLAWRQGTSTTMAWMIFFVGGNETTPAKYFLQQKDGKFKSHEMPFVQAKDVKPAENMGVLLFDADNDGDLDLYCSSGSNEFTNGSKNYQDQLFINDGKGNYTIDTFALPINYTSKSCVKAVDFDNDGDLDLFIGGRVSPGRYPEPVSSFIYRNDSKNGKIKFTDVTEQVAHGLIGIGLVCDAVWTDFDNDGWTDLILAGEWMPLTFFQNQKGKLVNVTDKSGIKDQIGWWDSIAGGDFDNDGDIDYIVGNLGENSFYRTSAKYPVTIYAKDFDNNKSYDAIPTIYLNDKNGLKKEYTVQTRDDIVEQLPSLKKMFLTYKSFGEAQFDQLFTKEQMKDALVLHATNFKSCLLKNMGGGRFELHPLPVMAQLAPLYGMVTGDFNEDGNLDVAVCGNDFGTEVSNGRYDALDGLVLLGDGKGNFISETILQSGLFIPGDAKAMIKLRAGDSGYMVAASQNRGPLKIFHHKAEGQRIVPLNANDKAVIYTLPNGQLRKEEIYYGSSFLSQSVAFISVGASVKKIEVVDQHGKKRTIQ